MARLTQTCNSYKSWCNSSSSSTWVAPHICSTHTLEISERIQATLPFQLKPAQSKTNVMISGLSELRLQQWDLEWDQPTTNDAFVDRSSRPIHLLSQKGLFWSNWGMLTTPIPRAWELKLLLPDYICECVNAITFVAARRSTEIVKKLFFLHKKIINLWVLPLIF